MGGYDYPKEKGDGEVPQNFARHRCSDANLPLLLGVFA